LANLIVVDGDPLRDPSLLTRQGAHMPLIVKGGEVAKHVQWG
jgi:imidazolonepropionase-like amidohydrolase